ncbi:MAG: trehalose-6-phosphate synthase [Terriglobales bacterium]
MKWKPILFLNRQHSHCEIEPYYRTADLCLVTSLHDGMNLVAKEFLAARKDDRGVLILSQFTGAARELRDALLVNPYNIEQTADADYDGVGGCGAQNLLFSIEKRSPQRLEAAFVTVQVRNAESRSRA